MWATSNCLAYFHKNVQSELEDNFRENISFVEMTLRTFAPKILPRSDFFQLDNDKLMSEKQNNGGNRARFGDRAYWKRCISKKLWLYNYVR